MTKDREILKKIDPKKKSPGKDGRNVFAAAFFFLRQAVDCLSQHMRLTHFHLNICAGAPPHPLFIPLNAMGISRKEGALMQGVLSFCRTPRPIFLGGGVAHGMEPHAADKRPAFSLRRETLRL